MKNSPPITFSRRQAFTLIELLVVVAIIGLLIAILLPVLNNARSAAKDANCRVNLQRIGQMILSYADDNGRTFPAGGVFQGSYRDGFASRLANHGMSGRFSSVSSQSSAEDFYREDGRIFLCPEDREGGRGFYKSYLATSFAMGNSTVENPQPSNSGHWASWSGNPMKSRRLYDVNASKAFLVVENWMYYHASNTRKVWESGSDTKAFKGWHFTNFPAHGKGSIDRSSYNPTDHNFHRNVLHADWHVGKYIVDPGSSSPGDLYYSLP